MHWKQILAVRKGKALVEAAKADESKPVISPKPKKPRKPLLSPAEVVLKHLARWDKGTP